MNDYLMIYLIGFIFTTFILLLVIKLNPQKYGDITSSLMWGSFLNSFFWPVLWMLCLMLFLVDCTAIFLKKNGG